MATYSDTGDSTGTLGLDNISDLGLINQTSTPPVIPNPDTRVLRPIILGAYLITFIVGLTGNILVLVIIGYYSNVRRKSVANYYIWNLSLADLLFILTLPFFFHTSFTQDWPFGDTMCKIGFALRETNRFSSIFILVALSWDRFIASFYNLSHLRTITIGTAICICIWVLCGLISIPYLIYAKTSSRSMIGPHNTSLSLTTCEFRWPHSYHMGLMTFWTYFQLSFGLLVPFCMICAAYFMLAYRLQRLIKAGQASSVKKPSRKTTRTVITVVLIFLICQTPYYVIEIWSLKQQQKVQYFEDRGMKFIPTYSEVAALYYVNSLAQVLVFISSCCNPVLYGLMNDNYRKLYRNVVCWCDKNQVAKRSEVELRSTDSNAQSSSSSSVTYRFQITFHKPTYSRTSSRKKRDRCRSLPTENVLLEERNGDKPSEVTKASQKSLDSNGETAGIPGETTGIRGETAGIRGETAGIHIGP